MTLRQLAAAGALTAALTFVVGAASTDKPLRAPQPHPVSAGYVVTSVAPYALPDPIADEPEPFRVRSEAIARVLEHEGGFAHHPRDPGGPTNYGITQRTARAAGYRGAMSALTRADAIRIYGGMWDDHGFGAIPDDELAAQAFDAFIAHGPRALPWIRDGPNACQYLNHRRMAAYRNSKNWQTFGRGWTKRINTNLARCTG